MRFVLVWVLCVLGAAGVARGQALSEADGQAIRGVIESQMAALQADDGKRAFGFASPGIQAMFGSPDTFMSMVRNGYPAVYRPRSVRFLDLAVTGNGPEQRVLLVGPDGAAAIAHYFMERQPDGSWRIDGCVMEETEDLAV